MTGFTKARDAPRSSLRAATLLPQISPPEAPALSARARRAISRCMKALIPLLLLAACATPDWRDADVAVTPAASFDLARYTGDWFEIARFPNGFEEGCRDVATTYTPRPDGLIDVVNTCPVRDNGAAPETAEGLARQTDVPARLQVRFAPAWVPFAWADYTVLWTDPDYRMAVVATPGAGLGWILARDAQPDPALLDTAHAVLRDNGFDPDAMIYPVQRWPVQR